MPITINGLEVRVLGADMARREAVVQWPAACEGGRVRLVAMMRLKGTKGGDLEVARVCREAERRARMAESAAASERGA